MERKQNTKIRMILAYRCNLWNENKSELLVCPRIKKHTFIVLPKKIFFILISFFPVFRTFYPILMDFLHIINNWYTSLINYISSLKEIHPQQSDIDTVINTSLFKKYFSILSNCKKLEIQDAYMKIYQTHNWF